MTDSTSMNVVLLAFHFPPDPAVGALRPAKLARAIQEAGHTITVITARLPEEPAGTRHTEPGLTVLAIEPQRNPRDWYASLKRRRQSRALAGASVADSAIQESSYVIPKRVPLWKRTVFSVLLLPDHRQGFIYPAIRAASRLLSKPGSVLYTTAPPFSTHLAGWWLAVRRGVPWIAEFRDPWTDNPWKPWHVRTALSDAAERFFERRVLARATAIVSVTSGIERGFRNKVSSSKLMLTARNGIDTLVSVRENHPVKDKPFHIVHIGSFYHGRDPSALLEALSRLKERQHLAADAVRLDLVGNCRWYSGISIEKMVEARELGDWVRFHDWVPHRLAQEFVSNSDLLLLLAQNQPDQIPNKLYEYLGARRPILALVDQKGESAAMLLEVGGHHIVYDNSAEDILAALENALKTRHLKSSSQSEAILQNWTTPVQMNSIVKLIEGIPR